MRKKICKEINSPTSFQCCYCDLKKCTTPSQKKAIRARRSILVLSINLVYVLLSVVKVEKQLAFTGELFICHYRWPCYSCSGEKGGGCEQRVHQPDWQCYHPPLGSDCF